MRKTFATLPSMQQTVLEVALQAVAERGYVIVAHPDGQIQAPGGGATDWPAVSASFLCPSPGYNKVISITAWVEAWNAHNGQFLPQSWEPTKVSVMTGTSGHLVATCELSDEAALLHALLTILADANRR
jgi:hypothetical protein